MGWRASDWFEEFTSEAIAEVGHEIRAGLTAIVSKTVKHAIDRLDNGDIKAYVARDVDSEGNVTTSVKSSRLPATLKDITYANAMFTDRWLLLQGKATRITGTEGCDRYSTLAAALASKGGAVIEGELKQEGEGEK